MTNFILGLIIGVIIGIGVVLIIAHNKKTKQSPSVNFESDQSKSFNPAVKVKKERTQKLTEFISKKSADDKITNDEVQELLKVSDATAERYLQELESKGEIKQIGQSGKHIYYQKA